MNDVVAQALAKAEFPIKLAGLFEKSRYKVAYGGRGGAKSWGIARALLIKGAKDPIRILCAREFQTSIKDSVHNVRLIPHPYPYQSPVPTTFEECGMRTFGFARLLSGAAWRARYQ